MADAREQAWQRWANEPQPADADPADWADTDLQAGFYAGYDAAILRAEKAETMVHELEAELRDTASHREMEQAIVLALREALETIVAQASERGRIKAVEHNAGCYSRGECVRGRPEDDPYGSCVFGAAQDVLVKAVDAARSSLRRRE